MPGALSVRRLAFRVKNCILGVVTGILLNFYLTVRNRKIKKIKAYGQLVLLGFTVTSFIPIAYQRHSL
jgi:hypothetical protein